MVPERRACSIVSERERDGERERDNKVQDGGEETQLDTPVDLPL